MTDEYKTNKERRGDNPRPRNEPTEPKEVSGQPRRGFDNPTSGRTTSTVNPPPSGSQKVGSSSTPRTGTTTGTSQRTGSNAETRGGTRNASNEPGMPKRSGPNAREKDR